MRRLYSIIWANRNFIFFLFLELASLFIYIRQNSNQKIRFFAALNEFTGRVDAVAFRVRALQNLSQSNTELHLDNAALKNMLWYQSKFEHESPFIKEESRFVFIPGQIVHTRLNGLRNYLLMDKGSNDGIQAGSGMVDSRGVIGIVTEVSPNYARVMPAANIDFKLGVRIKQSKYIGLLEWDGKEVNTVLIHDIPEFVDVEIGDSLVTIGNEGVFPAGVPVAQVAYANRNTETGFWEIRARLYADPRSSLYVYSIENNWNQEIETLTEGQE